MVRENGRMLLWYVRWYQVDDTGGGWVRLDGYVVRRGDSREKR